MVDWRALTLALSLPFGQLRPDPSQEVTDIVSKLCCHPLDQQVSHLDYNYYGYTQQAHQDKDQDCVIDQSSHDVTVQSVSG